MCKRTDPTWRKSSFCKTSDCVEVTIEKSEAVRVRDSKDPRSPVLTFTASEWEAFIQGVCNGEFDIAVR